MHEGSLGRSSKSDAGAHAHPSALLHQRVANRAVHLACSMETRLSQDARLQKIYVIATKGRLHMILELLGLATGAPSTVHCCWYLQGQT